MTTPTDPTPRTDHPAWSGDMGPCVCPEHRAQPTPTDPADVLALREAEKFRAALESDLSRFAYPNREAFVAVLDLYRDALIAATEQRARPSADVLAAVDGMLKAAKGDLVDARAFVAPRAYLADIDSAERHIDLARETLAATEQRARGQGSGVVEAMPETKALHDFLWDEMEWFSDDTGPMHRYTTTEHGQMHDDLVERFHDAYVRAQPATPPTPALTANAEAPHPSSSDGAPIAQSLSTRGDFPPATQSGHTHIPAADADGRTESRRTVQGSSVEADEAVSRGYPTPALTAARLSETRDAALRRWLRDDPWVPLAWEGARIVSWECYACEATLTLPEHTYITPEDAGHIDGTGREERCLWLVTRETLAALATPPAPAAEVERCPDADTIGCGHVHGDAVEP